MTQTKKKRSVTIATLNIAMHQPHSPSRYIELFDRVARARDVVKLGSVHAAMLGSAGIANIGGEIEYISGDLYRFLKISEGDPWFNTRTGSAATEEDESRIRIPDHLRPNLKTIPFVFTPKNHRLYFATKFLSNTLSPSTALKIFQELFRPLTESGEFPQIEITVIPDKDSLARIFGIPRLKRLEIVIAPPNPDDGEAEERRWLSRLNRQKAQRIEERLIALPGQSLSPDAETLAMAEVAASNGHVDGSGTSEDGTRAEESTRNHPRLVTVRYDHDTETALGVIAREATRYISAKMG